MPAPPALVSKAQLLGSIAAGLEEVKSLQVPGATRSLAAPFGSNHHRWHSPQRVSQVEAKQRFYPSILLSTQAQDRHAAQHGHHDMWSCSLTVFLPLRAASASSRLCMTAGLQSYVPLDRQGPSPRAGGLLPEAERLVPAFLLRPKMEGNIGGNFLILPVPPDCAFRPGSFESLVLSSLAPSLPAHPGRSITPCCHPRCSPCTATQRYCRGAPRR